ncbi:MAG: malonyl-CoA decarboxylase [Rhodobacteraceae bacterium]|nr:malonyl-CoA decarboxylase [Paracoccaceae bacterium]
MAERRFLNDLFGRMVSARRRLDKGVGRNASAIDLFDRLLGDAGEASGLMTAMLAMDRFDAADAKGKRQIFRDMAMRYGVDTDKLDAAIANWTSGDDSAARRIHFAAEPKSQELIRRLNRVPGATARLVAMRAQLLDAARDNPDLAGLDQDFQHLFTSWFNRGFLEIRQIDWSTPAAILEKIIAYEAVHEITGWDDLRQRVADPDRRLFAFFHPAMPSDPLIFVEVALTTAIPGAIAPIIATARDYVDPDEASVAVFYSISNCQRGLRGISFGNFLIKQVVSELQAELPRLKTFVTLSPVPGLRGWAASAPDDVLGDADRAAIASTTGPTPEHAAAIAARYLTKARRKQGTAFDSVAHFHLGNGAELYRVHASADLSANGMANAWGVMVNYLYDGDKIEANHQAYATEQKIVASARVRALATK